MTPGAETTRWIKPVLIKVFDSRFTGFHGDWDLGIRINKQCKKICRKLWLNKGKFDQKFIDFSWQGVRTHLTHRVWIRHCCNLKKKVAILASGVALGSRHRPRPSMEVKRSPNKQTSEMAWPRTRPSNTFSVSVHFLFISPLWPFITTLFYYNIIMRHFVDMCISDSPAAI
jgi:hypothetical protein